MKTHRPRLHTPLEAETLHREEGLCARRRGGPRAELTQEAATGTVGVVTDVARGGAAAAAAVAAAAGS